MIKDKNNIEKKDIKDDIIVILRVSMAKISKIIKRMFFSPTSLTYDILHYSFINYE